jgi:dihydrofolate synthase/folylpolyglutamate synthase
VFGAMADKDLAALVAPLHPVVDHWHCCDLPTPRAASAAALAEVLSTAARKPRLGGLPAATVQTHPDPVAALHNILGGADPADRILVFGSFYTVGGVLQQGLPRLGAAHLG